MVNDDGAGDVTRVLAFLRDQGSATRLEIKEALDLGRSAVVQRIERLIAAGLVEEGETMPMGSAGRSPRLYHFNARAGVVLAVLVGVTGFTAAVTDLNGRVIGSQRREIGIAAGPDRVLADIETTLRTLLVRSNPGGLPVWGLGIGLPGVVSFPDGVPVAASSMPGWDGYKVRERLERSLAVPCWVDNEVNLMALGELRRLPPGSRATDLLVIKVASGVGAGLISDGRVHRGARGGAGHIGHIQVRDDPTAHCICGRTGCLTAFAGFGMRDRAMARAATHPDGHLGRRLAESGDVTYVDVLRGAQTGDAQCMEMVAEVGVMVGEIVATLTDFFNPAQVILGGAFAEMSPEFTERVRSTIYGRSMPLVTMDLAVVTSQLHFMAGVIGAADLVVEELITPALLASWFTTSGTARPSLAAVREAGQGAA